jgi:hypothetical protein
MTRTTAVAFGLGLALCGAAAGYAQMTGGMNGMGGMGSGMVVTADDGSVLVARMGGGMMGPQQRALVNIDADGSIRWKVNFADRWPMAPATKANLVVVSLVDHYWSSSGATGKANLEGLKLSTGAVLWKVTLDGQMASPPQFSKDGKRIYVSVGDYSGTYMMAAKRIVALDLNGTILWTVDIAQTGRPGMGLN